MMKIFNNNYFLFGNLIFIILAIPVAMYLVKSQTTVRSNASSNTQITTSQNPETISPNKSQAIVNTAEISSEKFSQSNTQNNNIMFAVIGGVLIVFSIGIFYIAFRS